MQKEPLIGISITFACVIVFASLTTGGTIPTGAVSSQSTGINIQTDTKIRANDPANGTSLRGITWADAQNNYLGNNGFEYFNYPNKAIVKNAFSYGGITPSNTIFAYVAVSYSNTLTILNATRSWAQTEYSYYSVSSPHDIQLVDYPGYGRVAFICSYTTGRLFAINVTNPNAMSTLNSRDDSNNAGMYMDVDTVDKILYYTDWNDTGIDYLYAYNITNPHDLTLICKAVVPRGKPWTPKINDNNRNYVYVACEGEGSDYNNGSVALFNVTWVKNVTSPSMHYMKTQGFGSFADLRQDGKYLYGESAYSSLNPPIEWALHIWDVSNPTNLTTVSVTNLQTYGHFCLVKSPSGYDYAFVRHYDATYGDYGVNIADINDKSNPVNIGYIPDDGGGHTRDLWKCHWMQCAYNNITHNWVLYVIGYMDNSWVTFNISFNSSTPVASFTCITKGLAVTFDASSSYDPDGTIISWQWKFGDNTEGRGEVINHVYSATGTYNVTLVVTDNDGMNSSLTKSITVEELKIQKTLIFGKITNISTQGEYITFNAVRIRVIGFSPFNYTTFFSGEKITIMKEYQGFLGARVIFSLCSRLL
jgi:hypothetical protein